MGDYTVIFCLILFLFFIGFIKSIKSVRIESSLPDEQKYMKTSTFNVTYLGGLSGLIAPKNMSFKLELNKITIADLSTYKTIYFENLISFDIKSETSIQSDVTMTRLLALGVFAFAFKKKSTKIENYFVIKFKENGEERAVVLKNSTLEDMYKNLQFKYNYYKINKNNQVLENF